MDDIGTPVGVVHPGRMGVTVAAALVAGGSTVRWAGEGRSQATRERAAGAGLVDAGDLAALVASVDVLLSVCPPEAAGDVAASIAGAGYGGVYVDANAIAPATSAAIRTAVEAAGATYVDGSIIGPPATRAGTTRLYLAGARAAQVGALFAGSALDARVLDAGAFAASALKMSYASWTKGTAALLLAIRALARAEGVEDALLAEWSLSAPDLEQRSRAGGAAAASKAWRFVGEMREIATALDAAGLPGGFGAAPADLYDRLVALRDRDTTVEEALALLEPATRTQERPPT